MTDRETLEAMLNRTKIPFSVEDLTPAQIRFYSEERPNGSARCMLSVERGFIGFVTNFIFTEAGELLDMGAYE